MKVDYSIYADENIKIVRRNSILNIIFDRESRRNALSASMLSTLDRVADALKVDTEISVVVFSGGVNYFCAGADHTDQALFNKDSISSYRRGLLSRADICQKIESLPQVTISAIEGFAIGGGLSLALACDFRIMSEAAYLWVPELDRGSIYAWNSIPRLVSLTGLSAARRIVLLGDKVDAATSLKWNMVDFLEAPHTTHEKAMNMADKLSRKPQLPLEICKRNLNQAAVLLNSIVGYADADQTALCQQDLN